MNRKSNIKKRKNQKKILIMGSLSLILFLCVSYAAFSTNLSLTAKVNIKEITTAYDILIKLCDNNSKDGLYPDIYEKNRCFYKGSTPNNYIIFNNETWRIISVEEDKTIKIMRNEPIQTLKIGSETSNDWNISDTNIYLNSQYLTTITENQENIKEHTWNIGGIIYGNNDLKSQIIDENIRKSHISKIGVITVSEYLRTNTNITKCGSLSLNNTNSSICKDTNWIYQIAPQNSYLWTLTPLKDSATRVFTINSTGTSAGRISNSQAYYDEPLSPALYLTEKTKILGSGTIQDPFTIQ